MLDAFLRDVDGELSDEPMKRLEVAEAQIKSKAFEDLNELLKQF